jgi:hypothetical protein
MKTRLFAVLILLALMYQVSCKLPKSTLPPPKESSSLPGGMAGGSGNPKSNEGKKEPEKGTGGGGWSTQTPAPPPETGSAATQTPPERTVITRTLVETRTEVVTALQQVDIVLYCPRELRENKSDLVAASISMNDFSKEMKQVILNEVNSIRADQDKKPITEADLKSDKIRISDYIKLTLTDPSHRVDIKTAEGTDASFHKFDPQQPMEWRWFVTPKEGEGNKGEVTIYITVWGKKEGQNDSTFIKNKYYSFPVALKQTFWQSVWGKVNDITWLVAIIGSSVSFVAGLWQGRKKKASTAA